MLLCDIGLVKEALQASISSAKLYNWLTMHICDETWHVASTQSLLANNTLVIAFIFDSVMTCYSSVFSIKF